MKRKWLPLAIALIMSVIIAIPIMAATQTPIVIEDNTELLYGIGAAPNINTWYSDGRHWEMYINADSDLVYRSSADGINWLAETVVVATTALYGPELSVWYDADSGNVHYVRHELAETRTVYRMGNPASTGVITWAAVEQVVNITPSNLLTFRVNICTDSTGYPWVVWVDDDGIDTDRGIVYIESSSTKNGTWTEDVTATIDTAGYKVWFVDVIPVGADPYPKVEVHYSMEDIDGEGIGDVALMSADELDDFVEQTAVAAAGGMNATRPDAFGFHNLGSSVYCVYTRADGDLMTRVRSTLQTWATADAATEISTTSAVSPWIPTLAAYGTSGPGEALMCVINDNQIIKYATKPYSEAWSTFATVWISPDQDNDVITRHTQSYTYESSITGLTWQVSVDDGELTEYDTIYYWWFVNPNGWGYYDAGGADAAIFFLKILLPIVMAFALIVTAFGGIGGNPKLILIGLGIGVTGFVMIQAMLAII